MTFPLMKTMGLHIIKNSGALVASNPPAPPDPAEQMQTQAGVNMQTQAGTDMETQ